MGNKKNAAGTSLTVGEQRYFIDGVPAEYDQRPEWYLAQNKVNVFFARHLDEHTEPAARMRSWFSGKQPSESQVRAAMIWHYDSFGDYAIKSGGGAVADSIFSSHLTIAVADARTGEDRDVVLLKKHSSVFSEVLITIAEVERLERATETTARRDAIRLNDLPLLLRELIVWEKGVRRGGFERRHIEQMREEARRDYSAEEIDRGLRRLAAYAGSFENRSLHGGFGTDFLNHVAATIRGADGAASIPGDRSGLPLPVAVAHGGRTPPRRAVVQPRLFG